MAVMLNDADPCGTAAALRQAYADLINGDRAQTVTFRSGANGVEKSVSYSKADPNRLLALLREWEAKCAALTNSRPSRFSMRSGGRI